MYIPENKRTTVTVDERRKVFVLAKSRNAKDRAKLPDEAFIRQQLKSSMGYGPKDSAPDSIKSVAKEMAQKILAEAKAAADAAKAKEKASTSEEAKAPKGWDKVEGGVEVTA